MINDRSEEADEDDEESEDSSDESREEISMRSGRTFGAAKRTNRRLTLNSNITFALSAKVNCTHLSEY